MSAFFLPYQRALIEDASRFIVAEKARRIGLTYALAYRYTYKRALNPGKTWYTANDEATVREFIGYCAHFARAFNYGFTIVDSEEVVAENEKIRVKSILFNGGGEINGLSSNPNALHGKGGDAILDEFAYHKQAQQMWEAAQACTKWGDDLVVLSTHTSDASEFNQIVKDAKRGPLPGLPSLPWSYHKTDIHEAVEQGLVERINDVRGGARTREEFLAECRASCRTEEQWKRQYLCEPSSDASALLPYSVLLPCVSDKCDTFHDTWQSVFQGVDFARRGHNTVISNCEQLGDVLWERQVRRLNNVPWREQLGVISLGIQHPKFQRGAYDQTGLGDMPVEELQRAFGAHRIEGIVFNPNSKHNLATQLRARFDDRTIRIDNEPKHLESLNAVRATITADGRPRYEADDKGDEHGDDFWALALANWAATVKRPQYFASLI